MAWLFKGSSGGAGLSLHDVKEPVFKKEPVDSGLASASFSLFAGARRADGEGVSVFRLERSKGDEGSTKVQSALKCVKLAKTLRHPHVLPFHEGEAAEAGGGEVSVVTDEVLPLTEWLKDNGEDVAIINAVDTVVGCLREGFCTDVPQEMKDMKNGNF